MAKDGPILIIEDDVDDRDIMEQVLHDLQVPNELKFFASCSEAYHYLATTREWPFVVFCDINLPQMTGVELKEKINESHQLRRKSIPFIFLSTTSSNKTIRESYDIMAQGFFTKPQSIESLRQLIDMILRYWRMAGHPDPEV